MPPSNFGARASIATAWHCVGSPIGLAPCVEQQRAARVPWLYGVPRIRKLSAASPQDSLQPVEIGLEAAGGRDQRRAP